MIISLPQIHRGSVLCLTVEVLLAGLSLFKLKGDTPRSAKKISVPDPKKGGQLSEMLGIEFGPLSIG